MKNSKAYRASLTSADRAIFDQKQEQLALKKRLSQAVDLAQTYLLDGAPYSALRVLRDAVANEPEARGALSAQKES